MCWSAPSSSMACRSAGFSRVECLRARSSAPTSGPRLAPRPVPSRRCSRLRRCAGASNARRCSSSPCSGSREPRLTKLTLYSRPECHLCEALLADLAPLLGPRDSVETIDVDSSVALERRYGLRIPVLAVGELELSGYPLDRERVRRYLESS